MFLRLRHSPGQAWRVLYAMVSVPPCVSSLHVPVRPCSERGSSVSSVSGASTVAMSGGGMVCFYLISNFIIIKSIFTNIHFPYKSQRFSDASSEGWGNYTSHLHLEDVLHLLHPLLRGTDVAVGAPGMRCGQRLRWQPWGCKTPGRAVGMRLPRVPGLDPCTPSFTGV